MVAGSGRNSKMLMRGDGDTYFVSASSAASPHIPRRELKPQQRKTSNKPEFKKRDDDTGWSNKYLTYEVDLRRKVVERGRKNGDIIMYSL